MKSLPEDVEDFFRLRVIVTFESGRVHTGTFGPFTRLSKAREIRTRMQRVWNGALDRRNRMNAARSPDSLVNNIRYVIEKSPSFGWFPQSDDTFTSN